MVLIGILAAVAVPRMSNTINSGEEASENGVLAALESAVEMYAMDQVVANSSRRYPYNPFDHMEKTPQGYSGENSVLDEDGEWTFENGQWIAQLESAAEIKALDNVLLTGYKTYPSNPFNELDKTPSGYTNGNDSGLDDAWWFTANKVYHRRNGNVYYWDYNPLNGEIN